MKNTRFGTFICTYPKLSIAIAVALDAVLVVGLAFALNQTQPNVVFADTPPDDQVTVWACTYNPTNEKVKCVDFAYAVHKIFGIDPTLNTQPGGLR